MRIVEVGKSYPSPRRADLTVRVMAIAEGYAMVRHKGCAPFIVSLKELTNDR